MKPFFVKLHKWSDFLLPYALLLLVLIIVAEFFFAAFYLAHHLLFDVLDWMVISVFLVDLGFKFYRSKTFPIFLKTSWLDILAVIPFFLVFRLFESLGLISRIGDVAGDTQHFMSAGLEAEREAKAIRRAVRSEQFIRFLRPLFRTPRLLKGVHFFEHPMHKIKH